AVRIRLQRAGRGRGPERHPAARRVAALSGTVAGTRGGECAAPRRCGCAGRVSVPAVRAEFGEARVDRALCREPVGGSGGSGMTRAGFGAVAALAACFGSACSDRPGPVGPSAPSARVLTCEADVRSRTVTCTAPSAVSGASKISADLVLGGQGFYVALRSSNV